MYIVLIVNFSILTVYHCFCLYFWVVIIIFVIIYYQPAQQSYSAITLSRLKSLMGLGIENRRATVAKIWHRCEYVIINGS